MSKKTTTSLCLDEESKQILKSFSEQMKISGSDLFRKVLCFFGKNPSKLREILREEFNLNEVPVSK